MDVKSELNASVVQRDNTEAVLDSVRGLMEDLDRFEVVQGEVQHRHTEQGEDQLSEVRCKEREDEREVQPSETPTQDHSPARISSEDAIEDSVSQSEAADAILDQDSVRKISVPSHDTSTNGKTDSKDVTATAARSKSIWGLLLPSTAIPSTSSPVVAQAPTTTIATNRFSFFGKITGRAPPSSTPPVQSAQRLSRTPVDDAKLADLIISCADALHILKTSTCAEELQEVGLKLERGWCEQLAEAQGLRCKLEAADNTVEELEDENRHLRQQPGGLSEQIVTREEEVRMVRGEMSEVVERVTREGEEEVVRWKSRLGVERARWERTVKEERAFVVGLVLMFAQRERGKQCKEDRWGSELSSMLFDPTIGHNEVPEQVRRTALAQARPPQADLDPLDTYTYDDLFRCPTHRFAHSAAAPPTTLVDERVLLIGTDQRLLACLVQKLNTLGLTRVLVATPDGPHKRLKTGVQVTVDLEASDAWTKLSDVAGAKLDGEVDCMVNAFDGFDADKLGDVCRLLKGQCHSNGGGQAMSVVNVVYDVEAAHPHKDTRTCSLALIGLSHTLSSSTSPTLRLNTLVLQPSQRNARAADAVLRLIDPCSSTHGCVLHVDPHMHCLGPPLCAAKPADGLKAGLSSGRSGEGV